LPPGGFIGIASTVAVGVVAVGVVAVGVVAVGVVAVGFVAVGVVAVGVVAVGVGVGLPQLISNMPLNTITSKAKNKIFFILFFIFPPFNNRENRVYLDIPLLSPPSR
jgi:hypothetical protein